MTLPLAGFTPRARLAGRFGLQAAATIVLLLAGCAHVGRLNYVGHTVSPAPADSTERVALERLAPGARLPAADCPGGEEIFLLSGSLRDEYGNYGPGAWIRNPAGFRRSLESQEGATYWVKRGHLRPSS